MSSFGQKGLTALLLLFSISIHADPPRYGEWKYLAHVSDEFNDDSINLNKWQNIHPHWAGRAPGIFMQDNVNLVNGELVLSVTDESNGKGTLIGTSFARTKEKVKYGYFEIRAKANRSRASSAFFLYNWTTTGTYEIDIVEIGGASTGKERNHHSNAHVYYGDPALEDDTNRISDPKTYVNDTALADDYHVYAVDWDELEIRWYFDNQLIRRKKNIHWHTPMQITIDTETFPSWLGMPRSSNLPAEFKVDYLRVWQRSDIVYGEIKR
ncbi:family 16 glycosylhydrolase [Pseudoalteromonas tunicata]|uniref:Glycoside hydrolase, family 16 n=1 Tax=Pseudoalteromonas tunicata D2 TaxID=87626 RepID=A4C648_9GAMM|nr:family 16 glycosylhydrolase [Pseudoalteromonas tunicata]ATC95425.1 hypothetical protein PTUN_a3034 [Pseudoalteromonas tunicata]AXT31003.1 hypothetical protein D1819_09505 [Pseudoalteromonas tunicata]EAR29452.1 Glycoside hydrolase, family 16 [Pseudoalteromonas tunicata D2]MDP4985720.1 family 16 glycosylhydrolase [Pseudoalteromonas tunicata]MDP5213002.1 family 16 glycosylhydrolase [Pseudoalteromonas tunicata]